MPTPFDKRVLILQQVEHNLSKYDNWKSYFDYADLAMPLARLITYDVIEIDESNERQVEVINDAFDALVKDYCAIEDTGFTTLQEILAAMVDADES